MSVSFRVFGAFATFFCITSQNAVAKQEHDSALEFLGTKKVKVEKGFPDLTIDFGDIFVGRGHRAKIEFRNTSGKAISIASVETCCGCSIGFRKNAVVEDQGDSFFDVFLAPTLTPNRVGKQVTLVTNAGDRWKVNLQANIKPAFELSSSQIQIQKSHDKDTEFVVRLKRIDDGPAVYGIRSLGGYTDINQRAEPHESGETDLRFRLSADAFGATTTVVERLAIFEKTTDEILAQVPLAIRPQKKLIHRPKRLVFRKDEGDASYSSRGVLVGDAEILSEFPRAGLIEFHSGSDDRVRGRFKVSSGNAVVLSLAYDISDSEIGKKRVFDSPKLKATLLNEDESVLLELASVRFVLTERGTSDK